MKKIILFLLITGILLPGITSVVMGQDQASESIVPASDPQLTGPAVQLNKEAMSAHPRLLFGPKDLPRLREFYKSDKAKLFRESIEKLLPECVAPTKTVFLKDAMDGMRQGLWHMPSVSLHYALTGDAKSFEKAMGYLTFLEGLPHWEDKPETDSGMSSANIMLGAALTFDLLYNDMPADFREKFRKKLWYMARAQYYGGHLMKLPSNNRYWQQDPQNNHRWHRDAGMLMAIATAATGAESEAWMIRQAFDEMKFINQWLPEDGTSHEGASYLIFGATHLTLANNVCDRCFGTKYLQEPYYVNINNFILQSHVPGMSTVFQFGDSGGSGYYGNFTFKAACENHQADQLAGLMKLLKIQPNLFMWHWLSMVWIDPDAKTGNADHMPNTSFFKDMGLALIRDGWESKDIGVMFKCGPLGGYKMNEYRKAYAVNGVLYV